MIGPEDLRRVDLFDDLDDAALAEWAAATADSAAEPGEVIADHGAEPCCCCSRAPR
jgi:hypothetical protein